MTQRGRVWHTSVLSARHMASVAGVRARVAPPPEPGSIGTVHCHARQPNVPSRLHLAPPHTHSPAGSLLFESRTQLREIITFT